MGLAGIHVKEVMETLQIRNRTQLKTWMGWQKWRSLSFSKSHSQDTLSTLQAENRYLKQQIDVLKKYKELEREWY